MIISGISLKSNNWSKLWMKIPYHSSILYKKDPQSSTNSNISFICEDLYDEGRLKGLLEVIGLLRNRTRTRMKGWLLSSPHMLLHQAASLPALMCHALHHECTVKTSLPLSAFPGLCSWAWNLLDLWESESQRVLQYEIFWKCWFQNAKPWLYRILAKNDNN